MLCKNTMTLLLVAIAIFPNSVESMGVGDNKQSKHCITEEGVMETISKRFSALEKDLSLLKEQLVDQIMINGNFEKTINDLYEQIATDIQYKWKTTTTEEENNEEILLNTTKHMTDFIYEHLGKYRVKRQENDLVAFSAYVDHNVLTMGKDQIVQFQNVLLNDGNGYNKFTGIFTVPTSGVYMLIFFVEDYHQFQSIFHIVVNKNIVTSAIADPLPAGQNVQGGNVVLVRLNAGESVWVSVGVAGDDIEGYGTLRTSTFSGYLVYA